MVSFEQEPARAALDTLRQITSLLGVCPIHSALSSSHSVVFFVLFFFAIVSSSLIPRPCPAFRHLRYILLYVQSDNVIMRCWKIKIRLQRIHYIKALVWSWVCGFSHKLGSDGWIFACNKFVVTNMFCAFYIPNCYVVVQCFYCVTACCSSCRRQSSSSDCSWKAMWFRACYHTLLCCTSFTTR